MSDCKHEWVEQLGDYGDFRCVKCEKVGIATRDGSITPTDQFYFDYGDPFYEVGDFGRCPTMDEQERRLFDYYNSGPEE